MNLKEFFTPAVIWFLIGLVLLLLELAIPGLIIIFFGVGAWITSLSLVLFDPGLNMQLLIFIVSSVLMLVLLRRFLKRKFFKEGKASDADVTLDDEFVDKLGIADTDLKKGIQGKVSFKGTTWSAISNVDIKKGEQVIVKGKDSLTLKVTKNN